MCAAKLERTGSMLRNVWPNVRHFANEQSSTIAQSANESSFVRKNSKKVVQQRHPRLRVGLRPVDRAVGELVRGALPSASATSRRHFGAAAAPAVVPQAAAAAASASARPTSLGEDAPWGAAVFDHEEPERLRNIGASIDELVQSASEKYDLNMEFWGKYTDIPSMASATEKEDILQIIDNFLLIHRKHHYLFQRLKVTVLRSVAEWSAPDFAALCQAWAQLGFLHEDLCVAMAERVATTAGHCTAQELVWLMDAYATARCSVQSVNEAIVKQTILRLHEFSLPQLCLHASSFARLQLRHRGVFSAMADRFEEAAASIERGEEDALERMTARDVTLAAYAFAKLGFYTPGVFSFLASRAIDIVRDFTARDLQMLTVALARARHMDEPLLEAISVQAQRRIAQFNSESLVMMLRSMAYFNASHDRLFTRAVAQLPRAILTFRPIDVTTLLNAFAAAQVHSAALFDIVTPFVLEKAPMFTPGDWLSALRGYALLGHKDDMFLSALGAHWLTSGLQLRQLCAGMVACSKLSVTGPVKDLVEAAAQGIVVRGDDGISAVDCSSEAAAQMYSSLLLLGHSADEGDVGRFVGQLAERLRSDEDLASALAPATCASLCFATLVAAPAVGGARALDALALAERCGAATGAETPRAPAPGGAVAQPLLRQVRRALRLLPWNRRAAETEARLEAMDLGDEALAAELSSSSSLPMPYLATAFNHLAPHCDEEALLRCSEGGARSSPTSAASEASGGGVASSGSRSSLGSSTAAAQRRPGVGAQGVFVAQEIHDALEDMSEALEACGVEHRFALDADSEVHLVAQRAALARAVAGADAAPGSGREVAIVWGSAAHYVSGGGEAHVGSPLSLAAQFEVAYLRAARGMDIAVVPYWWWRPLRLSLRSPEKRGRALARRLVGKAEQPW